jgi:hypothetical protein
VVEGGLSPRRPGPPPVPADDRFVQARAGGA